MAIQASEFRTGYTDMGMSILGGSDPCVFVNRPERCIDWGWRATHEMTVLAKALVKAYYGESAQKAYFSVIRQVHNRHSEIPGRLRRNRRRSSSKQSSRSTHRKLQPYA